MSDQVLVITGASSGIGAATARQAADAGYRVVLGARSIDKLEALADELGGAERALAVRCDVTEWDDQQALVAAALEAFGRIDVAFANAGFGAARGFLESDPDHWRNMVLTNVYGCALTIRATLPALKESHGHLLLTGSVAGRQCAAGLALLVHEVGGDRHGRGRPSGAQRHRRARDAGRAGHGRHPFLRQRPGERRAPSGRRRRAVLWAVDQPAHVDINEVLIRPTEQQT